jgi:hypothetical protein
MNIFVATRQCFVGADASVLPGGNVENMCRVVQGCTELCTVPEASDVAEFSGRLSCTSFFGASVSFANYLIDLNIKIYHVSKVRNMFLQYVKFWMMLL